MMGNLVESSNSAESLIFVDPDGYQVVNGVSTANKICEPYQATPVIRIDTDGNFIN